LKEIAKKAKINGDVEIIKTIAGKTDRNVYEKGSLSQLKQEGGHLLQIHI
jgi:hypothetical protein